jgi:hypothetical protein
MKVYIVTDGIYSDYHIEAVFTDKEKAEAFAAIHTYNNVEEWDADELLPEGKTDVYVFYRFQMCGGNPYLMDRYYTRRRFSKVVKTPFNGIEIHVTIEKKNTKKAEKIAQDMYAQWKYEQMEKGGEG